MLRTFLQSLFAWRFRVSEEGHCGTRRGGKFVCRGVIDLSKLYCHVRVFARAEACLHVIAQLFLYKLGFCRIWLERFYASCHTSGFQKSPKHAHTEGLGAYSFYTRTNRVLVCNEFWCPPARPGRMALMPQPDAADSVGRIRRYQCWFVLTVKRAI